MFVGMREIQFLDFDWFIRASSLSGRFCLVPATLIVEKVRFDTVDGALAF